LQRALKHGTKELINRNGADRRVKICHDGIVFIYDEKRKREITSWVQALDLPYQHLTPQEYKAHRSAREQIETNPSQYCKSHTVLLIDTSGSMRESDVTGSRSRLAAVFYAVAEDFVRQRINSGVAGSRDAISILLMTETAPEPLIHNVPTDWLTYNQILEVYKKGGVAARGHCCYLPALQKAEEILCQYDTAPRTQLILTVLSDGRPSDSKMQRTSYDASTKLIESRIESLARQLGQRLTVQAIGIGSNDKNGFQTLQQMCHAADNFGGYGAFQLPSMSAAGLGGAMSSIATSLTESQLNDDEAHDSFGATGLHPRRIRKVARESRRELPMLTEVVDSQDFLIYKKDQDQVTHMMQVSYPSMGSGTWIRIGRHRFLVFRFLTQTHSIALSLFFPNQHRRSNDNFFRQMVSVTSPLPSNLWPPPFKMPKRVVLP
jgi:von Willebrand factor type A domain